MSEPIPVTQKQARGFLIANQGLMDPFPSPEEAVHRLFAIQTQYAASLPVALAARVKRMKPSWPDDALNRDPVLVKTWSMRSTLHVHHVSDRALLKSFNRPKYEKFIGWMREAEEKQNIRTRDNEELILAALQSGPKTRDELHDLIPQLKQLSWTGWGADVKGLAFKGEVIFAPSGPGASRFALAETWIGALADDGRTVEEVAAEMFRRYLRAHAPASLTDMRIWAGSYATHAKAALQMLKSEIVPVQVEKMKEVRYVLAEDLDRLLIAKRASGARLLAKFDPLLMSHWDKQLYLPKKFHRTVFQAAGQVEASVLIDGVVAGIWRINTKGKTAAISIQPFRPFTEREMSRIEKESQRLRRALGLRGISVDYNATHVPHNHA